MGNELTELDKKLQEIAVKDWNAFIKIIGEDAVLSAKICILRQSNKSYARISLRLGITPRIVQIRSGKCDCNPDPLKNN